MSAPRRILHVVGGMNRGGIETWLMHVLRNIDRSRFQNDFLVHTRHRCAYDEELLALGARLLPCPYAHQPLAYASHFRRLVAENGPYDVVHSHVHYFNGFVLRLAKAAGIPQRIAHSHNDPGMAESNRGLLRRGYTFLGSRWIQLYATSGAAASRRAAASLFGSDWQRNSRWRTLSYSIDLSPFRAPVDRAGLCAELGIPAGAFLAGHAGRFVPQKNHSFLLQIARELIHGKRPDTHLVLVGDGPLRSQIEREASDLGIRHAVHFLGVRPDVPRLMLGAMDLFLFPSHFEGLGLVAVEAQAAGLPCVLSDAVPEEADLVPPLIRRLNPGRPAAEWADAVLDLHRAGRPVSRTESLAAVAGSSFNIVRGVHQVEELYGD